MSENKKKPTKCNHCYSTNVIFSQWGRVEYYSCGDCKKEITEEKEPVTLWSGWDPKNYGFSKAEYVNSGQSIMHSGQNSDDHYFLSFDDANDSSVDIKKYFPGN